MDQQTDTVQHERLYTMRAAAAELGIPYFKIQQAVKRQLIPSYQFVNSRKYVRLNDITAAAKRANGTT